MALSCRDAKALAWLTTEVKELQSHIDWAQQHKGFAKRATGGAETKTSYIKKVSSLCVQSWLVYDPADRLRCMMRRPTS
jgi:hypothetical protein